MVVLDNSAVARRPQVSSQTKTASSLTKNPIAQQELPVRFGRYVILRSLGCGGMGTVYLAHDLALGRKVAIKFPNRLADSRACEQLLQEAKSAAQVTHPNVCSIYDVGVEAGQPYFTMEYISGKSLDKVLEAGKPMQQELAMPHFDQNCSGHDGHAREEINASRFETSEHLDADRRRTGDHGFWARSML